MDEPELIPLADLDRGNPLVWEGEQPAQGVFLDAGDDPLALLGAPSVRLPPSPGLPADFEASPALRAKLQAVRRRLGEWAAAGAGGAEIDVADLDTGCREALRCMLGEGEVTGQVTLDGVGYRITESLLTGLWHLQGSDGSEWVEVAPVPAVVARAAESLQPAPVALPEPVPGVMNGLAVLAEVNDHAARWDGTGDHNRVINFTLLPMSPEDQRLLIDVLGRADLALESGGFGQCRVLATTVRHVWAVQYLNAMGHIILDTLEIGRIPDAVLAAREDFEDSHRRLGQLLETYGA